MRNLEVSLFRTVALSMFCHRCRSVRKFRRATAAMAAMRFSIASLPEQCSVLKSILVPIVGFLAWPVCAPANMKKPGICFFSLLVGYSQPLSRLTVGRPGTALQK